ncbi:MAG: trypsin-like serine protease, partial [Proteobacteria bacterium]|nr:trypsin-like serine protease [Pseudomonadota bacterium]
PPPPPPHPFFVITVSLFLGAACMAPPNKSSNLASVSTYGGKEYKSFADLPPYFVELIQHGHLGSCSAAHIGDGYILTAAHCLKSYLCHTKEAAKSLGIRYITRTKSDEFETYKITLNYEKIEAVVMHKHYFVHPDSHIFPFIHGAYASNAREHDIALIKIQTDPQAPFAGKAILPTADQAALYSPQHVSGVLYQHGIGREFSPEYKEYKKSKDITPFKGNTLISTSYFGGSVQVVESDSQILKDLVKRYQEREEESYQMMIKKLQSFQDPHEQLAVDQSIARKREQAKELPCFQYYTSDKEDSLSSYFLFSEDGLTAQKPYISQPITLFKEFQLLIGLGNLSASWVSEKNVDTYAKKIAKAVTDLHRYHIQEEGRKWLIMITSGPEDDPDRVLKTCHGDSGGPIVKHLEAEKQKEYIHLGVAASFSMYGGLMLVRSALRRDELSTQEEREKRDKLTNCGQETYFTSTFAHLDWIAAAKASIEAGNHSYQKLISKWNTPSPPLPPVRE